MEDKAICSKVLACFELGVLFNPKVAWFNPKVACYSQGWLYLAHCGVFKAKVACWSSGGFTTTVAHLSPRLMLASTLKPDVGFTSKA